VLHAIATPLFTYRDNGRYQINYSGIGGDLASGAIANAYYPVRDRGSNRVFKTALIRRWANRESSRAGICFKTSCIAQVIKIEATPPARRFAWRRGFHCMEAYVVASGVSL